MPPRRPRAPRADDTPRPARRPAAPAAVAKPRDVIDRDDVWRELVTLWNSPRPELVFGFSPSLNRLHLGFNSDADRRSFDASIAGRASPVTSSSSS